MVEGLDKGQKGGVLKMEHGSRFAGVRFVVGFEVSLFLTHVTRIYATMMF
jgi:hypothetical protein